MPGQIKIVSGPEKSDLIIAMFGRSVGIIPKLLVRTDANADGERILSDGTKQKLLITGVEFGLNVMGADIEDESGIIYRLRGQAVVTYMVDGKRQEGKNQRFEAIVNTKTKEGSLELFDS